MERLELGRGLAYTLIDGLIRDGVIDPVGKSEREIEDEFADWFLAQGDAAVGNLRLTIDHTHTILSEADRHLVEGHVEFAAVMYAMYFEHWLNYLAGWGASRVGLDEASIRNMLRSSNLAAKTGYLWQLIFAEPLDRRVADVIKDVSEARNAFVHYKWRYHHIDSDVPEIEEQALRSKLNACKTIIPLTREVEHHLYVRFAQEYPLVRSDERAGD